jgi:hypothetical protein
MMLTFFHVPQDSLQWKLRRSSSRFVFCNPTPSVAKPVLPTTTHESPQKSQYHDWDEIRYDTGNRKSSLPAPKIKKDSKPEKRILGTPTTRWWQTTQSAETHIASKAAHDVESTEDERWDSTRHNASNPTATPIVWTPTQVSEFSGKEQRNISYMNLVKWGRASQQRSYRRRHDITNKVNTTTSIDMPRNTTLGNRHRAVRRWRMNPNNEQTRIWKPHATKQ